MRPHAPPDRRQADIDRPWPGYVPGKDDGDDFVWRTPIGDPGFERLVPRPLTPEVLLATWRLHRRVFDGTC